MICGSHVHERLIEWFYLLSQILQNDIKSKSYDPKVVEFPK